MKKYTKSNVRAILHPRWPNRTLFELLTTYITKDLDYNYNLLLEYSLDRRISYIKLESDKDLSYVLKFSSQIYNLSIEHKERNAKGSRMYG